MEQPKKTGAFLAEILDLNLRDFYIYYDQSWIG